MHLSSWEQYFQIRGEIAQLFMKMQSKASVSILAIVTKLSLRKLHHIRDHFVTFAMENAPSVQVAPSVSSYPKDDPFFFWPSLFPVLLLRMSGIIGNRPSSLADSFRSTLLEIQRNQWYNIIALVYHCECYLMWTLNHWIICFSIFGFFVSSLFLCPPLKWPDGHRSSLCTRTGPQLTRLVK